MSTRLKHITQPILSALAGADLAETLIGNMIFNFRQGTEPVERATILRNLRDVRMTLRRGLQLEGEGE